MMKFAGTYQIPTYAVPMLENGDITGLTDLDVELINGFIAANFPKGYVADWIGRNDPYSCSCPEFGMATDVIEADFYHV